MTEHTESFDRLLMRDPHTGLVIDMTDAPRLSELPRERMDAALSAMARVEGGALANADEGRMVGHYWLRAPALAPAPHIRQAIEDALRQVAALDPGQHTDVLLVGIGGSALGPRLVDRCLRTPAAKARVHFLDNTDPEGIQAILQAVEPARTLAVIVSKSGGTPETRNGMLAARARWAAAREPWAPHAIAVTGVGSKLDRLALDEGWSARLPIWDWVGGRTSVTGPVGLVPMALAGFDVDGFLAGAAACDALTRGPWESNPAAWLAAAWAVYGQERGDRALVIEPYRDRFALLGGYLQQLVMESLGKRLDRQGREVRQGLTVYGNKGSTDQHAFIQQVRDGRDDALVHFIETLDPGARVPVDDGLDAGDYLAGFLQGTRQALADAGRPSVTLTVPDASAHSLGMLIALFERAVGLYAELIDVNAYHQPGVEAGKRAAKDTLLLMERVRAALGSEPRSAAELASVVQGDPLTVWRMLRRLAATGRARERSGDRPAMDLFQIA